MLAFGTVLEPNPYYRNLLLLAEFIGQEPLTVIQKREARQMPRRRDSLSDQDQNIRSENSHCRLFTGVLLKISWKDYGK